MATTKKTTTRKSASAKRKSTTKKRAPRKRKEQTPEFPTSVDDSVIAQTKAAQERKET